MNASQSIPGHFYVGAGKNQASNQPCNKQQLQETMNVRRASGVFFAAPHLVDPCLELLVQRFQGQLRKPKKRRGTRRICGGTGHCREFKDHDFFGQMLSLRFGKLHKSTLISSHLANSKGSMFVAALSLNGYRLVKLEIVAGIHVPTNKWPICDTQVGVWCTWSTRCACLVLTAVGRYGPHLAYRHLQEQRHKAEVSGWVGGWVSFSALAFRVNILCCAGLSAR